MKFLVDITRGLSAVVFFLTLMGSSVLADKAIADSCPAAEKILIFDQCKPCRTDLNGDETLSTADLLLLSNCLKDKAGCSNLAYDVNGDGLVNDADLAVLRVCLSKSLSISKPKQKK